MCLPLYPFLRRVFALILLAFRYNLPLFEHSNGWPQTFIKVFLVDFNPVGIVSLSADFNAFKDLLLVGF